MGMRVGELARRTGVGVSTLRAWERRFQFLQPERSPAGHRLYEEVDVDRVDAVLRLVAEGLTLAAAIARVGSGMQQAGEAESMLYGQILEAAEQGVWVAKDGRTRYANRRMAEIMGYSLEELATIPVLEFFDPEVLPFIREQTMRVRAGQRLQFTTELRRSDGTMILVELNSTPILNQAGGYEGAVALVTDITERTKADAEARLRATLLDSIGEAVTASAVDGTIVYVNAAAERLFGWRAADVIGRASQDVFPAVEELDKPVRVLPMLLKGRRFSGRYRMSRHDGSTFVAHLTSTPAFDDNGEMVGLVGVVGDLTERDRIDRDLQTRERQGETLALLGAQVLRHPPGPGVADPLILTEAVEATRRLLEADQATVLDLVASAHELRVRAASPEMDAGAAVPAGSRSFAGYTALARKVIMVDNAHDDRRFDPLPAQLGGRTASAIGAPIFGPDGLLGVLVAESSTPNHFGQGDAHFVQGMANIIGTALLERAVDAG